MASEPDVERSPAVLRAFDIGCVVVGGIIGVGIFFTPSEVAKRVDGPAQLVTAWGLGGVLALLGALVFVDLSRLVPGHGGTFVYIHQALGRVPAFLYGWANWLVIQSGALCVVGLVMVQYLSAGLFGKDSDPSMATKILITALAILAFTVLNVIGLHVGRRVQNSLTVTKTLAVFLLVLLGLFTAGDAAPPAATVAAHPPFGWFDALTAAMLPVLFSFGGWQQGSFLAGAARRPMFDVPAGILGGVVVVVLAYITVNLSFLDLLGFEGAASSETIAEDAIRAALQPYGYAELAGRLFSFVIVVSALGIMNTICMAPPFVLHAMARKGLFFAAVGRLDPRFGTPTLGVLVQGLWAIVLLGIAWFVSILSGVQMLGALVDGVVFVDWLFFGLCGLSLLRLRRSALPGQLLVPAGGVVAAVFMVLSFAITAGAIRAQPVPSSIGLGICAIGLLFCRRRPPAITSGP